MSTDVLAPSGPVCVALTPDRSWAALLAYFWRSATSFALVARCRAHLDKADLVVPTKALAQLVEKVAPVRARLVRGRWVRAWPGNNGGGTSTLWLECRAGGTPPFALDDALLWEGAGLLEDFQLFEGKRLRLFVCSHEGFGRLYGTAAELQGLAPARHPLGELKLVGDNLHPDVLKHLRGDPR